MNSADDLDNAAKELARQFKNSLANQLVPYRQIARLGGLDHPFAGAEFRMSFSSEAVVRPVDTSTMTVNFRLTPPEERIPKRLRQVAALEAAAKYGRREWGEYEFVSDGVHLALDLNCGPTWGIVRFPIGTWIRGQFEFTFHTGAAVRVPDHVDAALKTFLFYQTTYSVPKATTLDTLLQQWTHFLTVRDEVTTKFFAYHNQLFQRASENPSP